jgi:hypothetical protein
VPPSFDKKSPPHPRIGETDLGETDTGEGRGATMPRRLLPACMILLLTGGLAYSAPDARDAAKPPAPSARPSAGTQQPVPPAPPPRGAAPAAPASSSGQADVNDTSPRGVLKLLAAALRDGDPERIRAVMHAATPAESKMVTAMAEMARAMSALQKAAVKQFGREAAKEVVGDTDATDAESKARIDSADVKISGDTATVTMEDGEETPVVLKRVAGHWKLPMSELSKGADPAALEERLVALADQARLVRDLAGEIESGKYNTPAQAHEAWQSRAMQASMQKRPDKKPDPRQVTSSPRGERR